ncbi:hypothetical protein CEXT_44201, partial [Caerostris extrusa]
MRVRASHPFHGPQQASCKLPGINQNSSQPYPALLAPAFNPLPPQVERAANLFSGFQLPVPGNGLKWR